MTVTGQNLMSNLNNIQAQWDLLMASMVLPAQTDKTYADKANMKNDMQQLFQTFMNGIRTKMQVVHLAQP